MGKTSGCSILSHLSLQCSLRSGVVGDHGWRRHHICRKNYATAILGLENLRKKIVNRDTNELATKQCKCSRMHKDLHNMCKFNQYLRTLRKSGTNASAMCVNSTYMCEFHHILRKNFAICVRLCNFFSGFELFAEKFTQLKKIYATAGRTGGDKYDVWEYGSFLDGNY